MKQRIFALYDSKVDAYLQPFFMRSNGEAMRAFIELLDDKNTQVSRYPADYHLFHLGEYDDETGTIASLPAKINLGCGLDFQKTARLAQNPGGAPQSSPELLENHQ